MDRVLIFWIFFFGAFGGSFGRLDLSPHDQIDFAPNNDVPSLDQSVASSDPPTCEGREYTAFPDPEDCHNYYLCGKNGDAPVKERCYKNLAFSPENRLCIHSMHVKSCEKEKEFKCETDGTFPDPQDCRKFYVCTFDRTYQFTCPEGTVYSSETNRCETIQPPEDGSLSDDPCGFKIRVSLKY